MKWQNQEGVTIKFVGTGKSSFLGFSPSHLDLKIIKQIVLQNGYIHMLQVERGNHIILGVEIIISGVNDPFPESLNF